MSEPLQSEYEGLTPTARRAALWSWIKRRLPPSGRVLDVGPAEGYMLRELTRRGFEVTALEPDPSRITAGEALLAREWASATFIRAPLRRDALEGLPPFDVILCLDALGGLEDDEAALSMLARALKPGGQLLLSACALDALYGVTDATRGHRRRYEKGALRERVRMAGLRVESTQFWEVGGLLPYMISDRILGRPIAEEAPSGAPLERAWRALRRQALKVEQRLPLPVGLSLLLEARRP